MATDLTEPAAAPVDPVARQIQRLKAQWLKQTMVLSDAGKIMRHPAFKAIIALGEPAVPIILDARPSLLVWALPAITGENPVAEGDDGKIDKLTEAWLQWGRAKGLL